MPAEEKPAWYASGLRFECTQCGGCCGGFPGFVWVSEGEADAIARHLGVSRAKFLKQYCMHAGKRVTFREVGDYDCIMLEDGGCRIYDLRPVQCRTFPFWNENLMTRTSWNAAARKCPGMSEGKLHASEEIERLRLMRD